MYNFDLLARQSKKADVFVTAEIGINHKGSFDLAKRHIYAAKECGADGVKFQVYKTEKFYNRKLLPDAFNLFKSFELTYDNFLKLKEIADSLDLVFYATPLDMDSIDFLFDINVPVIKIASSDITNEPFLYKIAQKTRKMNVFTFVSTGFIGLGRIKKVIKIFRSLPLAVYYCVSKYPAENSDFDLNFIKTLQNNFFVPIGFSDHSLDIFLSLGAVSLGAKMIERHFTVDNSIEGADNSISLNPEKFSLMINGIHSIEAALGEGEKKITQFEKNISYSSMRDIYSGREIRQGEIIKQDDMLLLRPGNGIAMKNYNKNIGKKSIRVIDIYEKI